VAVPFKTEIAFLSICHPTVLNLDAERHLDADASYQRANKHCSVHTQFQTVITEDMEARKAIWRVSYS